MNRVHTGLKINSQSVELSLRSYCMPPSQATRLCNQGQLRVANRQPFLATFSQQKITQVWTEQLWVRYQALERNKVRWDSLQTRRWNCHRSSTHFDALACRDLDSIHSWVDRSSQMSLSSRERSRPSRYHLNNSLQKKAATLYRQVSGSGGTSNSRNGSTTMTNLQSLSWPESRHFEERKVRRAHWWKRRTSARLVSAWSLLSPQLMMDLRLGRKAQSAPV